MCIIQIQKKRDLLYSFICYVISYFKQCFFFHKINGCICSDSLLIHSCKSQLTKALKLFQNEPLKYKKNVRKKLYSTLFYLFLAQ